MGRFFRFTRFVYESFMYLSSRVFGPIGAARIILVRDGEVLAVNQGAYYELPGGALKYNETFEEAAKREAMEETGVEIELEERIQEKTFGKSIEVLFTAKVDVSKDLEGSWEGKPEWLDLDKVSKQKWRYKRNVVQLIEDN